MSGRPRRAVIVGAGIGGLAAAIALTRAGLHVEVFEQAPELGEVGAGIGLWANAMYALEQLGLREAVESRTVRAAAGLHAWDGRSLVPAIAGPFDAVVIHRADLHRILLDAIDARVVTLDARCVDVQQDKESATVRFADGREAAADLVVGADGLHSVVRAGLFGASPPQYAGYVSWRAVTEFDHDRLRPGETWGRGLRFGHFPMRGRLVYWFAAQNAPEGARSPDDEWRELQRLFRGWHAPIPELIDATAPSAVLRNDTYDRPPIRTWSRGRITLLGDAAHPMTPNLGQGACQAIEDAVVLGRAVATAPDTRAALRSYESQRVARANMMVVQSRRIGAVAQWQRPWAVAVRNFGVKHLAPRMRDRQLSKIVDYRP